MIPKSVRLPFKKVDYASESGVINDEFELIDLALGHSPFGHPSAVDAIIDSVSPEQLTKYPAPYPRDLESLVFERFGLHQEERVFFSGAGSYGMLASILSNLISRESVQNGVSVLGYGPQFTNIAVLAERAQLPYESLPLPLKMSQDEKLLALAAHLDEKKQDVILYIDNPNNPTGDVASLETLRKLAEVTRETSHGEANLLIIDEAYGDFIEDEQSAVNLIADYPHIIVMRSLSKGVGIASCRVGYATMSSELAEVYENIQLVFPLDAITHAIAREALNPQTLRVFLEEMRKETASLKSLFLEKMEGIGIKAYPTNHAVSICLLQGPDDFYFKLLDVGIDTENMAEFKPTHTEMNASCVRVRVPGSKSEIHEVVKRLRNLL